MSKPTNSPKPKRVVSKAEYARIMARNAMLMTITVGCLSVGFVAGFACFFVLMLAYSEGVNSTDFIGAAVLAVSSVVLCACGTIAKRKVENVEAVQPATRKAVEALPAPDILVRASDAPRTPETVLLRAAQEMETPQEQLLRPWE